ncbi:MAG: Hint domain-containing protein [Cypionkella sp.]
MNKTQPEDYPMFMQDIVKVTTAFSRVIPRPARLQSLPVTTGLVAGTLVETAAGWRDVATLRIGDRAQTLDGGLTRILGLDRRVLKPEPETSLIHVPGGCHDACSDILLLPGQHVLKDTLGDATCHGAPFVLVPAFAMTVDALISRHFPETQVEVITLLFADEEVIFANSGVMLHCPGIVDGAGRAPMNSFFPRLDSLRARAFLTNRTARLEA